MRSQTGLSSDGCVGVRIGGNAMSRENGLSAFKLEMPEKIPRTEYSAHFHWQLVSDVTGIMVHANSDSQIKQKASSEFVRRWIMDFFGI